MGRLTTSQPLIDLTIIRLVPSVIDIVDRLTAGAAGAPRNAGTDAAGKPRTNDTALKRALLKLSKALLVGNDFSNSGTLLLFLVDCHELYRF